jgi:hypothetical protein
LHEEYQSGEGCAGTVGRNSDKEIDVKTRVMTHSMRCWLILRIW